MRPIYFAAGLILGLGLALFAIQNGAPVAVRFLVWQVDGSLAAVVLGSAFAGALIVLFFGIPQAIAARWRIQALVRELAGARASAVPSGGVKPSVTSPSPPHPIA
jgi:putative membrane protein